MDFFDAVDELLRDGVVRIDRPKGSDHPRHADVNYPLDYGFVDSTTASDGAGIDVFRGSFIGAGCVAVVTTIDLGKRDAEIKLLLDCTEDEVNRALGFLHGTLGLGVQVIRRPVNAHR